MFADLLNTHYDVLSRLALTIVHSLWQGALIFAILQIVLSLLKGTTASMRYSLLNVGIIALLSSSVITFVLLGGEDLHLGASGLPNSSNALLAGGSELFYSFNASDSVNFLTKWSIYLSAFWLVGVFIFLIKLLIDFYWAINLRTSGLNPVNRDVIRLCDKMRRKIGVSKTVKIFESFHVDVPLVVGHINPYILLPVGAVIHLSPLELEAVILHELSHIKRNDYIANILLMITEVVLFYHPIFWWLKTKINIERENRCDDIVISHVPPKKYAKALLKMEESKHQIRLAVALKDNNKFHLLKRIKRICMKSNHEFKIEVGRVVTALLLVGAFAVFAWADNELKQESSEGDEVVTSLTSGDVSFEPDESMPMVLDVEHPETIQDLPEPAISTDSHTDTVPPSMPNIGDYINTEISEELKHELEKYQEEMMKWQEEMMVGNEQLLQQQLTMAQEMQLEKTMQEMQNMQKELMHQELQEKLVQEETLRQTMEQLQKMEIKMAKETLEKVREQQAMMQEEMLKLQESMRAAEEIRSKELKTKMKAVEEMHKMKEKEMKAKKEMLKEREKELKKFGEAQKLRMEGMHEELLQLLMKEGYQGDFQNMNWDMEGDLLRLNQETLSKDLSENCLQILRKYDFSLEGASWQIMKQK